MIVGTITDNRQDVSFLGFVVVLESTVIAKDVPMSTHKQSPCQEGGGMHPDLRLGSPPSSRGTTSNKSTHGVDEGE